MAKDGKILLVDVGGDSLKMAEVNVGVDGTLLLEKFAFADLGDPDTEPIQAFAEGFNRLLKENEFTAKRVRLSLSGQVSFARLSKLPPLVGDNAKVEKIVEFEAKQTVPYPMDEVLWDYQLIRHMADGGDAASVSNTEVDDEGEFESLFVAVKKDLVTAYTDVLQEAGKEVVSVETAPVALFNAARATQSRGGNCDILLNIGGRSTSMVIADRNRIFVRNITIAGDSITQQIAKEFSIGFAEAEEMKRRHGFVALGGAYEDPDSEVAATISKIARNVMTRLHGDVTRSINVWRSQHGGNKPTRVFISGGGSLMIYVSEFFHEKLHLPVDYLNVFSAISIAPSISRDQLLAVAPMFPELVGMALREIVTCPVEITLIPDTIKLQRLITRKSPYFYASMGTIIICLLLFYLGVSRRMAYDRDRVNRTRSIVESTNTISEEVKRAYSQTSAAIDQYKKMYEITLLRSRWMMMMEDLQRMMPDTTWISSITYDGEPGGGVQKKVSDDQRGGRGGRGGRNAMGGMPMDGMPMGPQGGPPGGGPDGMGMEHAPAPAQQEAVELKELVIKGISLNLDDKPFESKLLENLKTSKFFSSEQNDLIFDSYEKGRGENSNLTTFSMKLKLKQPIKLATGQ